MHDSQVKKHLVLMRGLPSCGKSSTAQRLAEEEGGVAIEFDAFFVEETTGHLRFNWQRRQLPEARRWHFERVREAIDAGIDPIVVDDDHHPGPSAKAVAAYALLGGYEVVFAEPDSPWWHAIRPLLSDKQNNATALVEWAGKLSLLSLGTHSVPLETILARIERWRSDMTLLDILSWGEEIRS
jgi:hypothetical protein